MANSYILGLDLGTTSAKACLFDLQGHLIASVEEMITSHYPQQGLVEQDPKQIEQLAVKAVQATLEQSKIDKTQLIALSFSAAMHSLIALDAQGEPLSPAMIWADGRAASQVDALDNELKQELYAATGTPVHPMTPFTKLLWMKETGYEPYKQAAYFMSIKEYLMYVWSGERVIDYSMASATGMFSPRDLRWHKQALELAGVEEDQLSRIVPPTTVLQAIKPAAAAAMGVRDDLPVVVGAADGQLANLGIGAVLPGEIAVSVGTSGAIRQFTNTVTVSEQQETFCYAFTEDQFIVGGPTNNGGIVLQWLKDLLQDKRDFAQFLADADTVPAGADGLLFLPYINGERAPLWDQRAKGNFYGLSVTHQKPHFIRAVLEGITFNLYQIGSSLQTKQEGTRKIYVNGGLSRSPIWLQMMADVFNAEIYVSENHHGAAWGAAWTGLVALKLVPSFAEIKHNIPMGEPTLPNAERVQIYAELYRNYERLAATVAPLFKSC